MKSMIGTLVKRVIVEVLLLCVMLAIGFGIGYYAMWDYMSKSCFMNRTNTVPWSSLPYTCYYDLDGTISDKLIFEEEEDLLI